MGLLDMTPDQGDALMNFGAGLLGASGPSRMPVSLGQGFAAGMQQMQAGEQLRRKNKMEDDQFALAKEYKQLQEQQMRAEMAHRANEREMQQKFMTMLGDPNAGATPGGFQPQGVGGAPSFNMGQGQTAETYLKPAQDLMMRKQQGQTLTPDQEEYLQAAQGAIKPPQSAPMMDGSRLANLSALGSVAGVKGASSLMELAKYSKPDWQQVDNGGQISFVNKNSGEMPVIGKTMSPDAVASNQLGRDRLTLDTRQFENPNLQHIEGADGVYAFDPRTGSGSPVMNPQTGQIVQGGKGLTESQGKATTFGIRARESSNILDSVGNGGLVQPGLIKRTAEAVPLIGQGLGTLANITQSPEQQRVEQAQRDFVNSVLRLESGASISPAEFENAKRQYFPQPGDSEAVITQKRNNRESEIKGLSIMAGPGGKQINQPASAAYSDADLQHTAFKHGLSVEQVKQRLGVK